MSRIRCGIKTAKLGATVFGRRKPIAKNWWVGVWPLEDVEPALSGSQETSSVSEEGCSSSSEQLQPINQNVSITSEEGDSARGENLALLKSDQLVRSEHQEGQDAC